MKNLIIETNLFKGSVNEDASGRTLVKGVLQRSGAENQNGRVYPKKILEREVNNYQTLIKERRALGELDHPESALVSLKNASHIIKELWWKGDELMGRVELLNTPSGNIVKEIIKAGHTIGISSRGTGSVQQTNEGTLEVQPDFELVCWDFVSNPSTHGAFMNPISLNESIQSVSKFSKLDNPSSIAQTPGEAKVLVNLLDVLVQLSFVQLLMPCLDFPILQAPIQLPSHAATIPQFFRVF